MRDATASRPVVVSFRKLAHQRSGSVAGSTEHLVYRVFFDLFALGAAKELPFSDTERETATVDFLFRNHFPANHPGSDAVAKVDDLGDIRAG